MATWFPTDFFSSPGMLTALVIVTVVEILSVGLMILNAHVFREQAGKYKRFLAELGGEEEWGKPGSVLLPLYSVVTVVVTLITLIVFFFQSYWF